MYPQVIHSLLTVVTLLVFAWSLLALRDARHRLKLARRLFTLADEIESRIDALEAYSDRFSDSLARMNGRIGAMTAKVNAAVAKPAGTPEPDDLLDEADVNAEREALYKTLAGRNRG